MSPPIPATLEQVREFYEFLQGECPEGVHVKHPPRLSERKAFDVIWFLQERLRVLPDHFERCCRCGELFDTNSEGGYYRDGPYCESCYDRIVK
jgi:hypothetical protein